MTLSRKEFFRQGFHSLGETLLKITDTLSGAQSASCLQEVDVEYDRKQIAAEKRVAAVDNQRCLARSCGCFSCVDRCEAGAIEVVMGEGVKMDPTLCTGCGICEYLCPVTPKAITLLERQAAHLHT